MNYYNKFVDDLKSFGGYNLDQKYHFDTLTELFKETIIDNMGGIIYNGKKYNYEFLTKKIIQILKVKIGAYFDYFINILYFQFKKYKFDDTFEHIYNGFDFKYKDTWRNYIFFNYKSIEINNEFVHRSMQIYKNITPHYLPDMNNKSVNKLNELGLDVSGIQKYKKYTIKILKCFKNIYDYFFNEHLWKIPCKELIIIYYLLQKDHDMDIKYVVKDMFIELNNYFHINLMENVYKHLMKHKLNFFTIDRQKKWKYDIKILFN